MHKLKEGLDYLDQARELDKKYFDWPWSSEQWDELKTSKNRYLLLTLIDAMNSNDNALGIILFHRLPDCNHLLKILVSPNYRNNGFARKLLNESMRFLDKSPIYLEVAEKNLTAIQFYKNYGFQELTVKKRFYRDGSNALAMQLKRK